MFQLRVFIVKSSTVYLHLGLAIGSVPSANTAQRRKDQYKLDLQQQMKEQEQSKRRLVHEWFLYLLVVILISRT